MATQFNVATRDGVLFETNNADIQTAVNFPVRPNKLYWVEVKAIAFRTDTYGSGASYWRQACYRTNSASAITQVGATRTVVTDNEDAAGWTFNLDTSGTNIRVRVSGEGSPLRWLIASDIKEVDGTELT